MADIKVELLKPVIVASNPGAQPGDVFHVRGDEASHLLAQGSVVQTEKPLGKATEERTKFLKGDAFTPAPGKK